MTDAELKAEMDRRIAEAPLKPNFEVYGCHGGPFRYTLRDRIITTGLTLKEATELARKFQDRYDKRNPNRSSWTKRFYFYRLMT